MSHGRGPCVVYVVSINTLRLMEMNNNFTVLSFIRNTKLNEILLKYALSLITFINYSLHLLLTKNLMIVLRIFLLSRNKGAK